jgi:hypothetical protein
MVQVSGTKKTERITERDLEVLEFVARFGVIPRQVVAEWAETGRAVTAARERRLREAGLVEVLPGFGDSGRLVLCTRRGLRAVGREELSTPRFSPATLRHSAAAARVLAQLERTGHRVLSEREIEARERAQGKRVFSAECRSGRYHRPDLIILAPVSHSTPERNNELSTEVSSTAAWELQGPSSPRTQGEAFAGRKGEPEDTGMRRASAAPIAVEVELTDKSARRLDDLMRAWRLSIAARQFDHVRYLCSARALPYLERAVARLGGEWAIDVEPLTETGASWDLPRVGDLRGRFEDCHSTSLRGSPTN